MFSHTLIPLFRNTKNGRRPKMSAIRLLPRSVPGDWPDLVSFFRSVDFFVSVCL